MFIYVFDKEESKKFEANGFQKIKSKEDTEYDIFTIRDKSKADFSAFDNTKYKVTNRLNF